jgi:hypothetical protein|tara:strand:- start:585 stop:833 length:249 start_codon:yes stop_codon:yes gene_type:complete
MSDDYLYYRDLFNIFKVYTTPKLKRVLDANGIPYRQDGKGKPFCSRSAIEGESAADNVSLPEAMDNMDKLISDFPTSVTGQE